MPDVVDPATRSRMMSAIRGKNTRPEIAVRKALHARGYRYRLHARNVPGKPDMTLPRWKAAVFVNGCFWHGHDCHLFKVPQTRTEWWLAKINRNRERDRKVAEQLAAAGWSQLIIWECALKGRTRIGIEAVASAADQWLQEGTETGTIEGVR